MSGAPATAAKVGSQSSCETMPFSVLPERNLPGQRTKAGNAIGAFPVRVLLAAERRRAGIRPGVVVRAVVGRVHDDRVIGDAEIVHQLQQFADMHVVLDHAVAILVLAGDADVLGLHMGAEVHARAVPPHEEGLPVLHRVGDEALGGGDDLLVDRLHALLGQRAGVLDLLGAVRHWPRNG